MRKRGLSPRVRGNQIQPRLPAQMPGSIPACAGEPRCTIPSIVRRRVYPRVCGSIPACAGEPPRVRGNLHHRIECRPQAGSIPACAGEPQREAEAAATGRVYPRVCGGTGQTVYKKGEAGGLSPRVWGNLCSLAVWISRTRSIPACAGEPPWPAYAAPAWSVYPRVCGGTHRRGNRGAERKGLSPRVRGNLMRIQDAIAGRRSIPACAGEPTARSRPMALSWVYPRVCGGTETRWRWAWRLSGLSPRVRGNHGRPPSPERRARSIPACAGEPGRGALQGRPPEVYPRVCGGTVEHVRLVVGIVGLSPRVRGNRLLAQLPDMAARSIPACAGEPPAISCCAPLYAVYPRVCGGTSVMSRWR